SAEKNFPAYSHLPLVSVTSSLKSLRLRIDLGLLRREAESPIFLTTLFFLFAIYFSFSFKGKHPEICF
ncbi:TPA: hypothetical protein ACV8FH_005562, partial [Escherichia coli]